MKTVLLVPGFKEDIKSRDYKSTIEAIEDKGYKVKFVPIKWRHSVIHDWVAELDQEYAKHNPKETVLAGFSYGAMTAFMSATKNNPSELWLFSFSPYFAEDMPKMKQSWLNEIGKRRTNVFKDLSFNERASDIKCKTLIFVGDLETKKYPLVGERADAAHKLIPQSRLIKIANVGHDVANPSYIGAIGAAI
jgi:pimeloyl-ACP methyl ester carboxylesterase